MHFHGTSLTARVNLTFETLVEVISSVLGVRGLCRSVDIVSKERKNNKNVRVQTRRFYPTLIHSYIRYYDAPVVVRTSLRRELRNRNVRNALLFSRE